MSYSFSFGYIDSDKRKHQKNLTLVFSQDQEKQLEKTIREIIISWLDEEYGKDQCSLTFVKIHKREEC
jgi:hypothetical protein